MSYFLSHPTRFIIIPEWSKSKFTMKGVRNKKRRMKVLSKVQNGVEEKAK